MANAPAGKRPREAEQDSSSYGNGNDSEAQKRRRGHDDDRRARRPPSPRRVSYRDDRRDRDRDHDKSHRHSSSYRPSGRDRDRDRERDRERERDKDRGREHRDRQRSQDRDRRHARSTSHPRTNGHAKPAADREEGEISPHASRASTPEPRSQSQRTTLETAPDAPAQPAISAPPPAPVRDPTPAPQPEPELDLAVVSPPSTEQLLAERRARRAAILAKYSTQQASTPPVPDTPNASQISTDAPGTPSVRGRSESVALQSAPPPPDTPHVDTPQAGSRSASPALDSQFLLEKAANAQAVGGGEEQVSAADYDPSLDRKHDEDRRFGHIQHAAMDVDEEVEEVIEEVEEDMDDLFALGTPEKKKKTRTVRKIVKPAVDVVAADAAADPEGYYTVRLGETLDGGRYHVFSIIGKGMFSNVVRARDTAEGEREVAIKIIRAQETMYKAGLKEIAVLGKLRAADPDDKRHFIRLDRTFEHRGHLCLVFESLNMNLREVVKRFGKDVGLSLGAVRAYANQLFVALSLLKKLNLMHADLKPDNILVSENKALLKVCDLGSAADASEGGVEVTPYLVSRFYRAPEIILGMPYDCAIDMWSAGCTLYELYTGKILFPGRSNANMLLLMSELRGRFNTKLVRRARFADTYFDELGAFVHPDAKTVHALRTRDLKSRLMPPGERFSDAEAKSLSQFVDLLEKCLMLDPSRRITPREALAHSFLRG